MGTQLLAVLPATQPLTLDEATAIACAPQLAALEGSTPAEIGREYVLLRARTLRALEEGRTTGLISTSTAPLTGRRGRPSTLYSRSESMASSESMTSSEPTTEG
jgi:hypothetical protein